ncbi:hypothetical protein BN1088_1120014 [Sphingobacterium sp. PM2-P1-29]|nr:hypothetical protein BN1088_1120014 [Sphingobacterium sp. PM2-P1-29]
MIIAKTNSKKEFKDTSIATTASAEFGFSYQVLKSTNLNELDDKVLQYSTLKKYQQKCNNWLGLGSFANSSNLVDFMLYLDEPWVVDSQMQEVCLNFFKNAKGKIIQINKSTSIGRNDLCPCKSGIKYKRCCGV